MVGTEAATRAIATAEAEAGGTAYEIDDQDDDQTWELDVAVGDRSVEVEVPAAGMIVTATQEGGDLDDVAVYIDVTTGDVLRVDRDD